MNVAQILLLVTEAEEKAPPEAKDVVAGWTAFVFAICMIVATALVCWAFVRQMRRVNQAKDSGIFGADAEAEALDDITEPENEGVLDEGTDVEPKGSQTRD